MRIKDPPFCKGIPIKISGSLANTPRSGSGTITLNEEMVVPLSEFNDPIDVECFNFWPMLTINGIKWFYTYKKYVDSFGWLASFKRIDSIEI